MKQLKRWPEKRQILPNVCQHSGCTEPVYHAKSHLGMITYSLGYCKSHHFQHIEDHD